MQNSAIVKDTPAWKPGFFRRFPLEGIAILVCATVGIFGCLAVLYASDNVPVGSWSIQPSVYISIIITITNQLIPWALREGATVFWWRKALEGESTIDQLQRRYKQSNSFRASVSGFRKSTFVALAKSWVTLTVLANAPLIQRSSKAGPSTVTRQVNVQADAAPNIPNGFTGFVSGRAVAPALLSTQFQPIVSQFNNNSDIKVRQTGCQGSCSGGRLNGVGFAASCNSTTFSFNLNPDGTEASQGYQVGPATLNGTEVFASSFIWNAGYPGVLNMSVQYKNQQACDGYLQIRNCSLIVANVDYPVVVDGQKQTIALDESTSIFDDTVRSIPNIPDMLYPFPGPTTLGGMYLALRNQFNSEATLRFIGAVGYELTSTGATANRCVAADSIGYVSSCNLAFSDPSQELLAAARETMFRSAIAAANGTNVQSMSATETLQQTVYHSNYKYFAGAAAISLLAIALVLGTFKDFWRIGRSVSMSPLEIAHAFGTPMFANHNSNLTASELVKEKSAYRVRYGITASERLEMGPADVTRGPAKGRTFN